MQKSIHSECTRHAQDRLAVCTRMMINDLVRLRLSGEGTSEETQSGRKDEQRTHHAITAGK